MTVCIAEDRASCEPALRILVASLTDHCPGLPVALFCPNASSAFRGWLTAYADVALNPYPLDGTWNKYDIKPLALGSVLDAGVSEVLWIDSDILIARDFRPMFCDMPLATLAVTEEALSGGHADPDGLRARLWGMPVGRALPFTANTGVVRVTSAHRGLIEEWQALLESTVYRDAQARPWYDRPMHLAGDQEVLTALLASDRFADIPLFFMRRGRDIVQFFGSYGYTVRERLGHLRRGMAYFIHSQGFRPWWPTAAPTHGKAARFAFLYNALSPYTTLARRYRHALDDAAWLEPPTRMAQFLAVGGAPLTGFPLAAMVDLVRLRRKLLAVGQRRRVSRKPATRATDSDQDTK